MPHLFSRLILILLLFTQVNFAMGTVDPATLPKNPETLTDGELVLIDGGIRSVGNAPFSSLAISTEDYTLKLKFSDDALGQNISQLQGQRIRLIGQVQIKELVTVKGKHKLKQYYFLVKQIDTSPSK